MTRQDTIYAWALALGGEVTSTMCRNRFPGYTTVQIHSAFSGLVAGGNMKRRKCQRTGHAFFTATDKRPAGKGNHVDKRLVVAKSEVYRYERNGIELEWQHLPIVQLRG